MGNAGSGNGEMEKYLDGDHMFLVATSLLFSPQPHLQVTPIMVEMI